MRNQLVGNAASVLLVALKFCLEDRVFKEEDGTEGARKGSTVYAILPLSTGYPLKG